MGINKVLSLVIRNENHTGAGTVMVDQDTSSGGAMLLQTKRCIKTAYQTRLTTRL